MATEKACATVCLEEYEEACDCYLGWCPDCEEFSRECTEPDAENYDCENCGNANVMGAEQALICGRIKFKE